MRNIIRTLICILLCSYSTFAFEVSEELKLPLTGWDKVLQTSNGNTLLFHFEARKAVIVKVFDTTRKEIASEKYLGKTFDNNALERSSLHGIYEINGQAILFISQAVNNSESLLKISFNTTTGKVISEDILITSPSFKRRFGYSLIRFPKGNGYAVFCVQDLISNYTEEPHIEVFSEEHKKIKEVTLPINRKDFDDYRHVNSCVGADGSIMIFMDWSKIISYNKEYEHSIVLCYLGKDDTAFRTTTTKLPRYVIPHHAIYSHNPFGEKLNVTLIGATTYIEQNGLQRLNRVQYATFMLFYDQHNLGNMKYKILEHQLANKIIQSSADTSNIFEPKPIKMYTNNFGLNTLISEDIKVNIKLQDVATSHSYLGPIAITQVSDDGTEVWSEVINKAQFTRNNLTDISVRNRGTLTQLFRYNDPTSDWIYQFASFYSFTTKKGNTYVMYNDLEMNQRLAGTGKIIPVSTYTNVDFFDTDAFCYKVTKKRESGIEMLLDTSSKVNYSLMTEGADYNSELQTFAGLFVKSDAEGSKVVMAWRKFED